MAEADLGSVRYLATLWVPTVRAIRWLLVVSLFLDPAAVLLLLAVTSARRVD
jgi:hypothetical protein